MKNLENILNIAILYLCRIGVSLAVSLIVLMLVNLLTDNYFLSGGIYGIVLWEMLGFTKDKIKLNR